MVEKLTMFEDNERTSAVEYRETFQRRKDKLRERRVYPKKVGMCVSVQRTFGTSQGHVCQV